MPRYFKLPNLPIFYPDKCHALTSFESILTAELNRRDEFAIMKIIIFLNIKQNTNFNTMIYSTEVVIQSHEKQEISASVTPFCCKKKLN